MDSQDTQSETTNQEPKVTNPLNSPIPTLEEQNDNETAKIGEAIAYLNDEEAIINENILFLEAQRKIIIKTRSRLKRIMNSNELTE